MLEHSQSRQSQTSHNPSEALNNQKTWLIPENCIGLNVNEKYDIMNKLQEDALSVTYLVKQYLHNPTLGRFFQLKLYKPEILREEWLKEGVFEQIKNKLSLNSRLILSCYEYGEWNNIPFTIHDFFEWKTLENIISERENKPISSKFAVSCAIEVLKSLESLYSYPCEFKYSTHFIHGNLTPSKIIISQDTGMVLLADTGIIALYSRACLNDSSLLPIMETTYLSPEQINFEPISIASDIFTVGLLLLDLLSPVYREKMNHFSPEQAYEFLNEKLIGDLTSFNLNEEIIKILKKVLEPNENARYQTPALFIADLNAYLRKQYWVFDIQENIKTVFYPQEDSNKPNSPQLNLNKTLQLSTPKELVNSVPLDELTEEIDKITAPKIIEQKPIPPIINIPTIKEEKIIETTNKTAPLHRFEPLPLPIIKEKEPTRLNKKLIGIIVAAAVVLFVIISSIKGHYSTKQQEPLAAIQPTPVIINKPIPVIVNKPIPVVVNKPDHKINTPVAQATKLLPKPVVVVKTHPKTLPTPAHPALRTAPIVVNSPSPQSVRHINPSVANVSINAVPFATIDIPAANVSEQITPISNIKIPVAKSIAIIVRHGTCSFRKIVDSQEKANFNLRFNMYACKEY